MNLGTFRQALSASTQQTLELCLDGTSSVSPHFHVTEIGRVTKDFVDCGGVRRSEQTCVLQTLVAQDTEHRLTTTKLVGILKKATALQMDDNSSVDVEVQGKSIETWRISAVEQRGDKLVIYLAPKQTACLAENLCGIKPLPLVGEVCCGGQSNCC